MCLELHEKPLEMFLALPFTVMRNTIGCGPSFLVLRLSQVILNESLLLDLVAFSVRKFAGDLQVRPHLSLISPLLFQYEQETLKHKKPPVSKETEGNF